MNSSSFFWSIDIASSFGVPLNSDEPWPSPG
jgi:hypothetical protein